MYFETVDWATSKPSFRSSPWICGAPQSGFASVVRKALAVDQRRHRLTHYNNPNYTAQILALSLGVKW
jgi:hypothetical protein